MSFEQILREYLLADYKMLGVNTTEESRAIQGIINTIGNINATRISGAIAAGDDPDDVKKYTLIAWNNVRGFYPTGSFDTLPAELRELAGNPAFRDPAAALDAINSLDVTAYSTVFVMCDLDHFFGNVAVRLRVKSIGEQGLLNSHSHVVVVSPSLDMAAFPRLANILTPIEFELPNSEELLRVVQQIEIDVNNGVPEERKVYCTDELRDQVVQCLRGLTCGEAANVLSRAMVRKREWGEHTLDTIRDEKAQIINQSEALKFMDSETITSQNELGGYDSLISWLSARRKAYSKEARAAQIDLPKGICLIGVPGSGKSVAAMAVAQVLSLPLFTLDIGSIFAGLVGQSEANLRKALQQVTAQDGCVLMIDEVDKVLSNAHTASGDSGTTSRVFGTLLSWLSNKTDRTFVVVTMNRTTGLPPELLRAGRFDAMFYTDLPTEEERKLIMEIHMRKRGLDPAQAGLDDGCWKTIINNTDGFVGSELEQVVKNARYAAFDARQTGMPTIDEWLLAISEVTPLSRLDKKGVDEIREFCATRAKPVNGKLNTALSSIATKPGVQPRKRNLNAN